MKTLIKPALSLFILLAASFSSAQSNKLSWELNHLQNASQAGSQKIDVIVQFRKGASLPALVNRMVGFGARHKRPLELIQGGLFQIPANLLPILANDPDIAYISPDRPVALKSGWDYMLDAGQITPLINAGYSGAGIGVAVIDSGVRASHPDLQNGNGSSRVVYSQSFVSGDSSTDDEYGHGTHVAGLLAGNGASSGNWMHGVASGVNIINLRVLNQNGTGTDSSVIAAIDQAIQLAGTYNIRVINLSLGRSVSESYTLDPVCQAVEQAWKAGIVVVVAAGNDGRDNSEGTDGYATITVPGNDPYVITVGATNTHYTDPTGDDTIATYSSKGPTLLDHVVKPDLVAPGNRLVSLLANGSTLDVGYAGNEVPPSVYGGSGSTASYFVLSGTSMSTPVVSGTVALMLQRSSSLTPDQVKIRLMKTASKNYPAYFSGTAADGSYYSLQDDIFVVGAGYLNAQAAVSSNDWPSGNSLSPVVAQGAAGIYLQPNSTSSWATTTTWGTSVVWGSNVLEANSIVWGNSAVWGSTGLVGESIVWGTSIVWGSGTTNAYSEPSDPDNN